MSADTVAVVKIHFSEKETEALRAEELVQIVLATSGRAGVETPSRGTVMSPGLSSPTRVI